MRKWFVRLLGLIAVLFILAAGVAWFGLHASLPDIEGTIAVNGLGAEATIARDAEGIPVITASSRRDLAFATGFAHGQDRFFQMDLVRRQAAGELSELFGAVAVDIDKRHRFHRFRHRAGQVLASLNPDERGLLEDYASGVNAGLDSLGARPFEYFVIGQTPRGWEAEDTIIVVYAMFLQLNDDRALNELRRGLAHRVLDRQVYDWLYPSGTDWDAPLMGDARQPGEWPTASEYNVREFELEAGLSRELREPVIPGSNNWAVSGDLTANGHAMVANDMHLGLSTPNIYYRARLVQEGSEPRDVTGVTLPGTPFVVAGSNGHVAWGYTNSYGDWTDAVVIEAGDEPGTYQTANGDRPFDVSTETIVVDGGDPVNYEVRETIWGPVDDSFEWPDGEFAVRWLAHQAEAVNLDILALETVTTAEDAMAIANRMGLPPQNFVVGDSDGNIGWTIAGRIPIRAGYEPGLPAAWQAPGWSGWLAASEYPRIYNPPGGRLWTANARVADGEALAKIGDGGYDLAARAQQIRDALNAKDRFTTEDMLAIQYDDRALFLARWQALLVDLLDRSGIENDAALVEYRDLVANWIPRATPASTGYRLVRAFRIEVRKRVFEAVTAPVQAHYDGEAELEVGNQFEGSLWRLVTEQPLHLLPGNFASWDEFLLAVVRDDIAWFRDNYDSPLSDRTWGEYNTASIRHPLSVALPGMARWLDMPRDELNGDSNLPKAQGPDFGASERFSVSPGDEKNGLMHMPTGQSGHPMSPFYRMGHDSWVRGEPHPFLPGPPAHVLTLAPSSS